MMIKFLFLAAAAAAAAVTLLSGCGALGAPTAEAPGWVQAMDKLTGVLAKRETPGGPVVVTQAAPESNPLNTSGPIAGLAVSALTLLWATMRRNAVAHENAVALLGASRPVEGSTPT